MLYILRYYKKLPAFLLIMLNIPGIISIVVFYLLILGVGVWAARKKGGNEKDQEASINKNIF